MMYKTTCKDYELAIEKIQTQNDELVKEIEIIQH